MIKMTSFDKAWGVVKLEKPKKCPSCGNKNINDLNGLEFSCYKCNHLWNI